MEWKVLRRCQRRGDQATNDDHIVVRRLLFILSQQCHIANGDVATRQRTRHLSSFKAW
ncbi:hypothetical protein K443DRAFT_674937 [Laccaria amethystina LaAM-08-1]|uniref:Uncharacterized protein n=1 Tax=Laccaria amethystina LaAM-08-1 TaxID=1095629 RepID=A0A0C9XVM3_9AGAR|nr:hypothetical protein K443DRAFT_674937 [Laccaria amethystina LaAM-08-1]